VAKKRTRRPNLPAEALERARAELRGETASVLNTAVTSANNNAAALANARPKIATGTIGAVSRRMPSAEDLRKEYEHVSKDLRKLGVISVLLFGIVIAASIILPTIAG
jgi:hypothetical protein